MTAFERDERPNRKTSYNWQLNRVDNIEHTTDKSGIYVLINWDNNTDTVRLDIVSDNHEPIISFAGGSDNVRKAVGRWIDSRVCQQYTSYRVSAEHAAYIGSELEKADTMRIDYVQDGVKTSATLTELRKADSELVQRFFADNKSKADDIIKKYD